MRKTNHRYVLLLITFLLLGTEICHSKELIDISTDKNLKEWFSYFFRPNSTASPVTEKELINFYWQRVDDLPEYTFHDYEYKCNRSKDYCISIDYNFEIVKRNGNRTIELLDPDSFIHLVDIKNKSVSQIFSMGSVGTLIGAFWSSEKSIILYGIESDNGFIIEIDLVTRQRIMYEIEKRYRRPNTLINKFILGAQQWSSADR